MYYILPTCFGRCCDHHQVYLHKNTDKIQQTATLLKSQAMCPVPRISVLLTGCITTTNKINTPNLIVFNNLNFIHI
jgi:hypothetical protein